MTGGFLVVLESQRCSAKRFPLQEGLLTIGRDNSNNIRIAQPSVALQHATIDVRDDKVVVRSCGGTTLVNGVAVNVRVLKPGDVVTVGSRHLRWDLADQAANPAAPAPQLPGSAPRVSRATMRRSAPPAHRHLLTLQMSSRHSLPGGTGGKQVAIVQPQRRHAADHTEPTPARASPQTTRRAISSEVTTIGTETEDKSKRKSAQRASPKHFLQNTTKATLWIESRKTSPRRKLQTPVQPPPVARRSLPHAKSTPLRLTVLKRAQSARKDRVIKIEAPLKIDHTKQAAIMLMTGHTPKAKLSISPKNKSAKKSPSYVVKKASPVRKTPRRKGRQSGRRSKETGDSIQVTPSRGSTFTRQTAGTRGSKRNTTNPSVSILEISDSTRNSTIRASNVSTRSSKSNQKSPSLPSPKKSAMKDHSKKSIRKTESIKFDLSNLESHQDSTDVVSLTDSTQFSNNSDEDITLHYSETSAHSQSPSPRRSIHSRSSRMLERIGTTLTMTSTPASSSRTLTPASPSRTLTIESPIARRSIRSSALVQKVLDNTASDRTRTISSANSSLSDRTRTILSPSTPSDRTRTILTPTLSPSDRTRTISSPNSTVSDRTKTNRSANSTAASAFRTKTLSPRSNNNLESYSVVDLVSLDSEDPTKSVYNSADSTNSSEFGTPQTSGRRTRSTLGPNLGTSTPYAGRNRSTRSKSSSNATDYQRKSTVSSRRSKSLSTPENQHVSVNATRISRASRSRSRINDSDLLLLDETEVEDSPKTSRRSRATKSATKDAIEADLIENEENGMVTPENRHSPETVTTPVLSIQTLLNSSRSSTVSRKSARGKSTNKRKTIGVLSEPKRRADGKSKSLGAVISSVRKTRLRLSNESDRTDEGALQPDNEENITPRSAVKPSPESVKNKHSTAKKPLSKRSIIDDLNSSDIVKQLFNSPVKRKLSQSMTEFSRRQLFDDDNDDISKARRLTRRTIAVTEKTPDNSLLEPQSASITPERFVSPVETPTNSPNLSGLQRLFRTPVSNSRRGGGDFPRATRSKSIKNDLTNVSGVKTVFAKSPRNDLRRVTGVKTLFKQTSPKNDLTDVRGVRKMFQKKSPTNDLRNVSGVKRTIRKSPKNDLTDVRGVRRMFKPQKETSYHDVSGVEELFDFSARSDDRSEALFDTLVGRQPIKNVYSKTFTSNTARKPVTRRRSLRNSVEITPNNVNEWLEQELEKRHASSSKAAKELQKLATDTLEGSNPIQTSRTRNSSFKYERSSSYANASTLPIKKRSLIEASMERRRSLPLKKRAVHSTPMKGRVEVTMNASELGRVSPIAVVHAVRDIEQDGFVSRSTQTINEDTDTVIVPKTRTPRKQVTPKKIDISKALLEIKSPEKPLPKRATRKRKVTESSQTNVTKNRLSLVIAKKSPVMSPKVDLKDKTPKAQNGSKVGPRKTRAARVSLVVPIPSPKMKPRPTAKATKKSETNVKTTTTRNRKETAIESKSPSSKRSTRAKAVENEPKAKVAKTKVEKPAPTKRGRNVAEVESPPQVKKTRKAKVVEFNLETSTKHHSSIITTRRGKLAMQSIVEEKPKSPKRKTGTKMSKSEEKQSNVRGRKTLNDANIQAELGENEPKRRGRKAQNQTSTNSELKDQSTTRGRRAQIQTEPEESQPKPRGRKAQNKTNTEPKIEKVTRGRKPAQSKKESVAETSKHHNSIITTRKGKANAKSDEKRSNSRSNRAQTETSVQTEPQKKRSNARGKTNVTETSVQTDSKTRRGQKANAEDTQPKTRGKKVENPPSPVSRSRRGKADATVVTETQGRKRKAPANEEVPAKIAKTEPKKGKVAANKTSAKQKRDLSKESSQAEIKETASTKASKSKQVEKKTVQVEAKPTRGRKVAEVKEVSLPTRQPKRKANVEPSPAKASKKAAKSSPARTTRRGKAKPQTPVSPKVQRSRRR